MIVPAARSPLAIFPWGDVIEEFLEPLGLTAEDFAGKMSGGWLFGYASALQLAGWSPIIVCASERSSTTRCLTHKATGTPIWIVPGRRVAEAMSPSRRSIARWLATPRKAFRAVLESEACRAIVIQEYEYTRFDILVRMARDLGIRAFASFQGGDRSLSWLESLIRNRSIAACDGLIIASSAERARVARRYGRQVPVVDIPNPLDAALWSPVDRTEARLALGVAADAFIVINHGRVDISRKGLDILLVAWSRCEQSNSQLVIIGSGQDHDAFARLLSASGLKTVHWLSAYTTDRALVRRWLSAADVYVSASRIEGMPVAPLEAMACGLPIVATDAQGLPDIFANGAASGGLIVPRSDATALANAIEQLRASPVLRNELGAASRLEVSTRFSIDAAARSFVQLLQE